MRRWTIPLSTSANEFLEGLRNNREAWRAERDRHDAKMYELRVELLALLERGIEAGWGRKALSKWV
jgi:hypothetical protein